MSDNFRQVHGFHRPQSRFSGPRNERREQHRLQYIPDDRQCRFCMDYYPSASSWILMDGKTHGFDLPKYPICRHCRNTLELSNILFRITTLLEKSSVVLDDGS